MTRHRIPLSTLALYTADDIADAERDLAYLMAEHAECDDPVWREELARWIADDAAWLAEMTEAVAPPLPLVLPIGLPIGLPAPGPVRAAKEGRA